MIRFENDDILLSGTTAESFFQDARHPDAEMSRRRDDFLNSCGAVTFTETPEGFSVHIPNLNISKRRSEVFGFSISITVNVQNNASFSREQAKPQSYKLSFEPSMDKKQEFFEDSGIVEMPQSPLSAA